MVHDPNGKIVHILEAQGYNLSEKSLETIYRNLSEKEIAEIITLYSQENLSDVKKLTQSIETTISNLPITPVTPVTTKIPPHFWEAHGGKITLISGL